MLENSEAVILAGGQGTRLAPALPQGWPKTLAPIHGIPFLAHLLDHLYRRGLRRVTLCLGYGSTHVEEFLVHYPRPADLSIQVVVESTPVGTAGALCEALAGLRSDPFFALNGDTYSDVDLDDLLASHLRCGAAVSVALAQVDDVSGYGQIELGADGRITRFGEKGPAKGRGLANAGTYVINRAVISGLSPARTLSWEYDVLPGLAGRALYGFTCGRWFVDIGTPESLQRAASAIAQQAESAQ